jgi:hypothetical protein
MRYLAAALALLLPVSASAQGMYGPATITSGNIDGAAIGNKVPGPGTFSTLSAASVANPARFLNGLNGQNVIATQRGPNKTDDANEGLLPGSVWNGGGGIYQQIAPSPNNATWGRLAPGQLVGDIIGRYVSAASISAAGTGYATNEIAYFPGGIQVTVTAQTGGVPTAISVTQPYYKGCPAAGTQAQLKASASGTGLTITWTVLSPGLRSVRRVTTCYTGPLFQVTNSVSTQATNINYLADNSADYATAFQAGAGATAMGNYANYNSDATPIITALYNQNDSSTPGSQTTQATSALATGCTMFPGRKIGTTIPILCHAQADNTASRPYPAQSFMTLPSAVTLPSGQNVGLVVLGGSQNGTSGPSTFAYLNQTSGGKFMSLSGGVAGIYSSANSSNATITFTSGMPVLETGSLMVGFADTAGIHADVSNVMDSGTYTRLTGTPTNGQTATFCAIGGVLGSSPGRCVTTTFDGTEGSQLAAGAKWAAQVNADTVLQGGGVVMVAGMAGTPHVSIYAPTGSSYTYTATGVGVGVASPYTALPNVIPSTGSFTGGGICQNPTTATRSGNCYIALEMDIPFPLTVAMRQQLAAAVAEQFGLVPQPGLFVAAIGTSNSNGFLTPFAQDMAAEIPNALARNDVLIWNQGGTGGTLSSIVTNWTTSYLPALQQIHPKPNGSVAASNAIMLIYGGYNDLAAAQTVTQLYTSYQTLAANAVTAGMTPVCVIEGLRNKGATDVTNMQTFRTMLNATPANCSNIVDLQTITWLANTTLWPLPWFEQNDTGGHPAPAGNSAIGATIASALRQIVQ